MAYELTIDGYTFDNPPNKYRKNITVGNSPVPHFNRPLADYYQSDQQELQVEFEGRLSLNEQNDLDELEELQTLGIQGGEVEVDFDPFFSGKCVIEDDPFRQANELSTYRFILTVNEITTDSSAYPAHATPTTGNTFKLGSFDFGYDPDSVEENYERQTNTVDRLQGISRSVDSAGLVTKVSIDGNTDGGGLVALWDKARNNVMSYLEAEFQQGWALIADLSIQNNREAPDYLKGLFQYSMDLFVVSDPESGIGKVSSFIDHGVKNTGTYVSDSDAGDETFSGLEFTVESGSGSINDNYVSWDTTTLTLSDNATNWVFVTDDNTDGSGTVKYNNSGFPADSLELYKVYTSGGDITKIEDIRAQLIQDNDSDAGDSTSETADGDLYYTVAGGTSPDDPNNQETTWVQTTVLLAFNATNYIFVEDPDADGNGTVAINQSGYPSNTVSLWRVVTDGDSITAEYDDRPSDLTEDGSGDTSDSDLVFETEFTIDDTAFAYVRRLGLTDSIPFSAAVLYKGLFTTTDEVKLSDGPLTAKGIATLSDPVALEDGGSAVQGTTETKTWDSSTEWNNATSEFGMDHPSGTLTPHKVSDQHDDGTLDTSKWDEGVRNANITEHNGYADYNYGGGQDDRPYLYTAKADPADGANGSDIILEATYLQGDHFVLMPWWDGQALGSNGYGSPVNGLEVASDGIYKRVNGSRTTLSGTGWNGLSSGDVVRAELSGDHNSFSVTAYKNGSQTDSVSGASISPTADIPLSAFYGRETGTETHADDSTVLSAEAQLTTGTKTFSLASKPDLESLSYAENGGQITLDVIGSPGTADEEIVSQSLDGSTSYDLTWTNSHTDFRVRVTMTTPSLTATLPTLSSVTLASSQSSTDNDQNPQTTWTIFGGQYDTSGNEYEGGGVVTKYAQ